MTNTPDIAVASSKWMAREEELHFAKDLQFFSDHIETSIFNSVESVIVFAGRYF